MRRFLRYCGSIVLGVAAATVYGQSVQPINGEQAVLFVLILAAVPVVVMSFKDGEQ